MFVGELISLGVAVSWTATALFAEVGSKRMGSLPFNVIRMTLSLLFLCTTLWLVMGVPYPRYADGSTWTWLLLSGVVGHAIHLGRHRPDALCAHPYTHYCSSSPLVPSKSDTSRGVGSNNKCNRGVPLLCLKRRFMEAMCSVSFPNCGRGIQNVK